MLNALATAWDLPVMEACLEAGRHYLAMGAGGPRDITGAADLDDQLALDDDFDTGELLRRFRYQTTSHDESWERWGVQGAAFQTGASAACAVTQFARGEIVRRGVFPAEVLDPAAYMAEMEKVGLAVGVMDLPAD